MVDYIAKLEKLFHQLAGAGETQSGVLDKPTVHSCQAGMGRHEEVPGVTEVVHSIRYKEEEEEGDTTQLEAAENDTDSQWETDSPR